MKKRLSKLGSAKVRALEIALRVLGDFRGTLWKLLIFLRKYHLISELLKRGLGRESVTMAGDSLLHIAAERGDTALARITVANGAQVNQRNCLGETAAFPAIKEANLVILQVLIEGG